jgi:hypothetical protein
MARGSKAAYTPKQRRKARHIEQGYEESGLSEKEAARRAWATVNKQDGGGLAKRSHATSRRRPAAQRRTTTARRKRSTKKSRQ